MPSCYFVSKVKVHGWNKRQRGKNRKEENIKSDTQAHLPTPYWTLQKLVTRGNGNGREVPSCACGVRSLRRRCCVVSFFFDPKPYVTECKNESKSAAFFVFGYLSLNLDEVLFLFYILNFYIRVTATGYGASVPIKALRRNVNILKNNTEKLL